MTVNETETVEEAQKTFTLDDVLKKKIRLRGRTVTVYTDEVTGEELGGVEPLYQEIAGQKIQTGTRKWGVRGKLDDLRVKAAKATDPSPALKKEIAALEKREKALAAELEESGLTFHMRAVPPIIVKDTRRRARAHLGITSKQIPEAQGDDYLDRQFAELLSDCTTSVTDSTGAALDHFDVDVAVALQGQCPPHEFGKLQVAIGEIQYQAGIAQAVTESADF